jgi:hypothetical protein
MIPTIRAIAKLCVVVAGVGTVLQAAPSHADNLAIVSNQGSGVTCTFAQPCLTLTQAFSALESASGSGVNRVICFTTAFQAVNSQYAPSKSLDIDCPGSFMVGLIGQPANIGIRVHDMTFTAPSGFSSAIIFQGGGTLILENCNFVDNPGVVLDLEPTAPLNVVIRNSRLSSSGSGILLKPGAGGSINATLDHVVLTGNTGGGIKTDSTNGVIKLDISDSEISNNGGNGVNAIAGASQNIVNIKNSVITRNGAAGVQANGANVGILIGTTLFDQNAAGATSVVAGGNMFSYGDNRIVGSIGSGFNQTAQLH